MKPSPEQPSWLYEMRSGIEGGRFFSVLMEGPRFAIVKEPGRRYMSGQESAYGAVDYVFVDKTADPAGGTGLCRYGVSLQSGGRLTDATKAFWKTLVEAPDRETVDKLIKDAQEEKAILGYCQHLADTKCSAPRAQLMHKFGINRAEADRLWGKWAIQNLKLSTAEIAAARARAEELGAGYFNELEIGWEKANRDKRVGSIHAWAASGEYLGQFKTHERAIATGAATTQFLKIWFTWGE